MDVHGGRTDSAVLVPLFTDAAGDVHAVFTKRREDLKRHAGEISFPGGRRDDGETLVRDRAARGARGGRAAARGGRDRRRARARRHVRHQLPDLSLRRADRARLRVDRAGDRGRAGAGVPPRRPRRRPLAQAAGPARDGVQDRRLRGRRPHGLGRHRAHPGRLPVQDRSRSTAATASATHSSPRGSPLSTSSGICQVSERGAGDRLALGGSLRRRSRARRCRRASPAASAAARRAGRGPDRADQPADDRDAVQRVHQRRDPVRVADVGLGAGRGDLGGVRAARGPAHGVARRRAARGASARPRHAARDDQDPRHSASTSSSVRSGLPRRRRISFCAAIICSRSSTSLAASTSGERVGFQSRISSAERFEKTPEQRPRRRGRRRPGHPRRG